jgi:hypothetical protein
MTGLAKMLGGVTVWRAVAAADMAARPAEAQMSSWETSGPAGRRASEVQIATWSSFNNKPLCLDRTFGFQRSAQPSLCIAISHAIINASAGQFAVRNNAKSKIRSRVEHVFRA